MILNKIFIHLMNKNNTYEYKDLEKSCEKIADDYAIEFLNWYISKSSIMDKKYIGKTSEELIEIFKKEKGL